jgi:flagellar motility protein MotE (MotC chaperone)
MKKILIFLLVAQSLILVGVVFYYTGVKKYGTPGQFQAKQAALVKAAADSLRAVEMERLAPENAGDTLMYDLGRHIKLFEKTDEYERRIKELQVSLDSLKKEKDAVERIEKTITSKENLLKVVQDQAKTQNLGNLAKMFDAMKVQQALPVIIEINDTLAVGILTRMQNRNSSKLLGAIAQVDTAKAVRLSRLIARIGTLEEK